MATQETTTPIYPPRRPRLAPPQALRDYQAAGPTDVKTPFGCPATLFTRYEDVRDALRSEATTSDPRCPGFPAFAEHRADAGDSPNGPIPILDMDGDEHAHYRMFISPLLTVRAVKERGPRIEAIVDGLLDRIATLPQPVDLVAAFTTPFSSLVACDLMSFPEDGRARFGELALAFLAGDQLPTEETDRLATRGTRATLEEEMQDYLRAIIDAYDRDRGTPDTERNPFLDRLLDGRDRGDLTYQRVVDIALLTYEGAFHTTAAVLALSFLGLLTHPEQADLVRAEDLDERRMGEELLRWTTVVNGVARLLTGPVSIGGRELAAGEGMIMSVQAANYDPEVFEDPDRLDVTRPIKENLAFGQGRHQCVGKHLARAEVMIAVPRLLRRFPRLQLAKPAHDLAFREAFIQGLDELPVTF